MQSLLFAALALAAFVAAADPASYTVFSHPARECTLSLEASPQWGMLRLRVQHPRYESCPIAQRDIRAMLPLALAKLSEPKLAVNYTSLSLGRLVDYPWLSAFLADMALGDPDWNKKAGKPLKGGANAYVARILSSQEVTDQFRPAFAVFGYEVIGAGVEKVLVGNLKDVPFYNKKHREARIPFDAQVWLSLRHD